MNRTEVGRREALESSRDGCIQGAGRQGDIGEVRVVQGECASAGLSQRRGECVKEWQTAEYI